MLNIDLMILQSIKDKQKSTTNLYRAIKAEITNYKTSKNAKPYNEGEEIRILKKMINQRKDAEVQYHNAGRADLANKEKAEWELLESLLPKPVSKEDLKFALLKSEYMIDGKVSISKKEMGKAIKYLKDTYPIADGKIISDLVKTYLI